VVVENLAIGGAVLQSPAFARHALWRRAAGEFLVVESDSAKRWHEVAHELTIALGVPSDQIPTTAGMLSMVLAASSEDEATAQLDALGFFELAERVEVHADEHLTSAPVDADQQQGEDEPAEPVPVEAGAEPSEATQDETNEPDATGPASEADGHQAVRDHGGATDSSPPVVRPPTGTGAGAASKPRRPSRPVSRPHRKRDRLKSYVAPKMGSAAEAIDDDNDDESLTRRRAVDQAAVEKVLEYERRAGRTPEEMPHENAGFDVRSTASDGSVRYIEVKGTSPNWDAQGVGLTSRQFQEAQRRTHDFWLYVVAIREDGASEPYRIQDPATRVDRYFFDDMWRLVAESDREHIEPLAAVPSAASSDAFANAVPLIDYSDGSTTGRWVEAPSDLGDDIGADEYFAVQIAGTALGLSYRGGLAFARRASQADDDDLVVVDLCEMIDPDTNGKLSVRYWSPELGVDDVPIALRLESDGGIPPISLNDPTEVEVIGIVVHRERSSS